MKIIDQIRKFPLEKRKIILWLIIIIISFLLILIWLKSLGKKVTRFEENKKYFMENFDSYQRSPIQMPENINQPFIELEQLINEQESLLESEDIEENY